MSESVRQINTLDSDTNRILCRDERGSSYTIRNCVYINGKPRVDATKFLKIDFSILEESDIKVGITSKDLIYVLFDRHNTLYELSITDSNRDYHKKLRDGLFLLLKFTKNEQDSIAQ
jgi:hypothetical protein